MFNPESFKDRVRKAYPDNIKINIALDQEDVFTGDNNLLFYLASGARRAFSLEMVLEATSLEALQNIARDAMEKEKLFMEYHAFKHNKEG